MSVMSRSLRNLLRNKSRTAVVTFIVGFALAIFLTSSMLSSSITSSVSNISENLETAITVRPAGSSSMGMMAQEQEYMNETLIDDIWTVSHVDAVNPILTWMEVSEESSETMFREMTLVQAMDPSQGVFLTNGGSMTISSGRQLDSNDTDLTVAVIGEEFASSKGLEVDSVFSLNETAFTVVGVYTTGTLFGDRSVILPYEAAKVAYNVSGASVIYVMADSISTVDYVVEYMQYLLGDEYDIVSVSSLSSDMSSSIQDSIDAITSSSESGALISIATAGAVMIFVMILITRERTKEIGVLKALGFSNSKVASQLMTESVALSLLGLVVGVAITLVGAQALATMFVGTTSSSDSTFPGGDVPGAPRSVSTSSSLGLADMTLDSSLLLFALLLAIVLGILGSLYPVLAALRLRPAEALRYDF